MTPDKPITLYNANLLYNADAELSLIGVLILNNERVEDISFLIPEYFYIPMNQCIFACITTMRRNGFAATASTLVKKLLENEKYILQDVTDHITGATHAAITLIGSNIEGVARIILDYYVRRSLLQEYQHAAHILSLETDRTAYDLICETEQKLFELSTFYNERKVSKQLPELVDGAFKQIKHNKSIDSVVTGVSTGLHCLDKYLAGLQKSDLLIIAGRPSMGKTALAINIAVNISQSHNVAFFSLEMSSEQLTQRILAMQSGIDLYRIRNGMLKNTEFEALIDTGAQIKNLKLLIDDTPGLTIQLLRSRVRRMIRKNKEVAAVFVDYLQLMSGFKDRNSNRVDEIRQITYGLKYIAKEFDIPVVALSQLSRAVEQRDDKRPLLSDLRESGTIEQDADVVMFIYREEYYKRRSAPEMGTHAHMEWQNEMSAIENKAEIIIAKQRNGAVGTANLHYNANTTTFDSACHAF